MNIQRVNKTSAQVIDVCGNQVLISYSTPVAARIGNRWYKTDRKWSSTTSKHINKFVPETVETRPQAFFDSLLTVNLKTPDEVIS